MKKYTLVLFAALALVSVPASAAVVTYTDLASFQGATSGLVLINFNEDPSNNPIADGTPLGSIYSSLGVVFPDGNSAIDGFAQPNSPPNGWINSTSRYFDATFPSGATAVGVFNVLFAGQSTLTIFDAGNNPIGSAVSDGNLQTLDFFGLTSTLPFYSIQITVGDDGGWGLDDLYFSPAASNGAIPEPSSLLLLGGGLAALLALRRKRA